MQTWSRLGLSLLTMLVCTPVTAAQPWRAPTMVEPIIDGHAQLLEEEGRRYLAEVRRLEQPWAELRSFPAPPRRLLEARLSETSNGRRRLGASARYTVIYGFAPRSRALLGADADGLAVGDFWGRIWDRFAGDRGVITSCADNDVCVLSSSHGRLEARLYDQEGRRIGRAVPDLPQRCTWSIGQEVTSTPSGAVFTVFASVPAPEGSHWGPGLRSARVSFASTGEGVSAAVEDIVTAPAHMAAAACR